MDGFAANEGVVVLAATNRAGRAGPPALLRPGRFDRQIYVGLPDIKGREEILKVHAKGKPARQRTWITRKLAQGTAGFTGADPGKPHQRGRAAGGPASDQRFIAMQDSAGRGRVKVIAGPEKHSRVISRSTSGELTAWHEAGHAVVMHCPARSGPGQPDHHRPPGTWPAA